MSDGKRKRLFFAHNSCLNASYDFNLVKDGLRRTGHDIVTLPDEADEIVFSGCGVRELWVDDVVRQLNALRERAPTAAITVTGCVARISAEKIRGLVSSPELRFEQQEDVLKRYTGFTFEDVDREVSQDATREYEGAADTGLNQLRNRVGPQKAAVIAALEQIDREHGTRLEHAYRRRTKGFVFYHENEPTEFIAVTRSCPYRCSFCAIPRGRGNYVSVPMETVLSKARAAAARGVRRITLLGDEVGNYGIDLPVHRLHHLIDALLAVNPELRISIRYIEPKPFVRYARLFERLCGEGRVDLLYVSLQSGSPRVLRAMHRRYDLAEVAALLAHLRDTSQTVVYSNWMVGFPSETHSEFLETVALVQQLQLQINVAVPFSARPNTPALGMGDQVTDGEKSVRLSELMRVIADMKAAEFAQRLSFLPAAARDAVLAKIHAAEMVSYDDAASVETPAAPKRLITLTKKRRE